MFQDNLLVYYPFMENFGELMENSINNDSYFFSDYSPHRFLDQNEETVVNILDSFLTPEKKRFTSIENDSTLFADGSSPKCISQCEEISNFTKSKVPWNIAEFVYEHISMVSPPKIILILGERLRDIVHSICVDEQLTTESVK